MAETGLSDTVSEPNKPDLADAAESVKSANPLPNGQATAPAVTPEWEDLRSLLLRPEQEKLTDLTTRVDFLDSPERNTREVSQVLPDAITLRSKQDKRLVKALQPTFEEALRKSIEKDPTPFINAVAPVMGAAIRKAIAEAFAAMRESLTRTLDNSISLQSFQWRWEARRTGKPFSEVVMLHTVAYKVEQVFLIHLETGLLLQHAVADKNEAIQDADMVSGMLTAIQDFVRDSFNTGESLDTMKLGGTTVWVEQGPQVLLACAIRGAAPPELRLILQDALDSIQLEFHDQLTEFQGDAEPFVECRPYLEACLQMRYVEKEPKRLLSPTMAAVLVLLLLALAVPSFFYISSRARWNGYVARLRNEPGIRVVNAQHGIFGCAIEGLRDPLAADPQQLLSKHELTESRVTGKWSLYQDLGPVMVVRRAPYLLKPPGKMEFSVADGVLYANGEAPPEWLAQARPRAIDFLGVKDFALKGDIQVENIKKTSILFDLNSDALTPEADAQIKRVAAWMQQLNALQPNNCRVEVTGGADQRGTEQINEELKKRRATAVSEALQGLGVSGAQINWRTDGTLAANRSVSFSVLCAKRGL